MYKLQANRGLLCAAGLIAIIGCLLSAYFYMEDSYCDTGTRGLLTLIATCILSVCALIAATSHFWFRHLWHHRPGYKRG